MPTGESKKTSTAPTANVPIFAGEDTPHPDPDSPFATAGTNVHMEQLKDMLLTYNEYNKRPGLRAGHVGPAGAHLRGAAGRRHGLVGLPALHGPHGAQLPARPVGHAHAAARASTTSCSSWTPSCTPTCSPADSTNFFFFFRMLLVWYKREFAWMDVLRLWEALWTDYLSSSFHLFVALAILEKHREVIMMHLKHFDEVLKYGAFQPLVSPCLSSFLSFPCPLHNADLVPTRSQRALGHDRPRVHARPRRGASSSRFQRLVEAVDRKENFPRRRGAGPSVLRRRRRRRPRGQRRVLQRPAGGSPAPLARRYPLAWSRGSPSQAPAPTQPTRQGTQSEGHHARTQKTAEPEGRDPAEARRRGQGGWVCAEVMRFLWVAGRRTALLQWLRRCIYWLVNVV